MRRNSAELGDLNSAELGSAVCTKSQPEGMESRVSPNLYTFQDRLVVDFFFKTGSITRIEFLHVGLKWKSKNAPVLDTLFTMVNQEEVTFDPLLTFKKEPLIAADGKSSIRLPIEQLDEGEFPWEYKSAVQKLKYAYFTDHADPDTIVRENVALMSDLNFNDSLLKTVKAQAKANAGKKKTFFLRFGIKDKLNWIQKEQGREYNGTANGEELCYIFHCHVFDAKKLYDDVLSNKDSLSYKLIKLLVKTVTNFARTGDSSVEGYQSYTPISSSDAISINGLTNDLKITVNNDIEKELRYSTWRSIEDDFNQTVYESKLYTVYDY